MSASRRVHHDVVVVGARAAGAATALLLSRLGHDVVVVERAHLPSDTISTHQIARTGVVALHRWGLLTDVLASGSPALRQVTFHTEEESVTRAVKDRSGVDHLLAPRRYVLDALLAEAAGRAGALVRTGITIAGAVLDDSGRATGVHGHDRNGDPVEISARFVVGADGLSSPVARSVGAGLVDGRAEGDAEVGQASVVGGRSLRVDVPPAALFATLDAVKAAPEAARFQFRAANEWISGTHSRSTIDGYFGVGEERSHERTFHFDADHPAVLVGRDNGPTPVEYVLHALATCLTAGLANIAAARGVRLTEVRSTVAGDIDLGGILGLDPQVRNGYQKITVRFTVRGDASAEVLNAIVEQSRARSAVFDVITGHVPVTIEVDAG